MERSISALTYKGSIPEAIIEAKKQKKLFVVYISGADAGLTELEKSTWTDPKVAESLSKYCILLHILDRSANAANFLAIYPQKSVPSIAAIGYNGFQLWHNEGFISAEVLSSSLEKAWLSLHIQETTATVLTAALNSRNSETSASGPSDSGLLGQGISSGTIISPSPSMGNDVQSSQARPVNVSEMIEENKAPVEENDTKLDKKTSSELLDADNSQCIKIELSTSPPDNVNGVLSPVTVGPGNSMGDHVSPRAEDHCPPKENFTDNSGEPGAVSHIVTPKAIEVVQEEKTECVDDGKANMLDTMKVNALSDVLLNIRMPNGISLQEKFSVTSTLRMVKDYVDKNQASGIGSYDLAIPYPRKVFNDEDLSKSLSDLGLFNRQALIVVPRQRATSYHRGSSSSDQIMTSIGTDTSNANGGYFAYIKRMLSYINPLSYLRGNGNPSSSGQAQGGTWEYAPNPALQNNFTRMERPYSSNHSTSEMTGRNDSWRREPTSSRMGSNIHTLKDNEDDGPSRDRNTFWNGNSTQYGGNNDGK